MNMKILKKTAFLACLAGLSLFPVRAFSTQLMVVELQLVLAVDVSSSVSSEEYVLQVQGLATALSDQTIQSAIAHQGQAGVAVSVIQWASPKNQAIALNWVRLTQDRKSVV